MLEVSTGAGFFVSPRTQMSKILLVASGLSASRFTPPALHVLHDVLRETGLRESDAPIVSPEAARFTIMKQSPNIVVAMGDDAARACIPSWNLSATKARGYLFEGIAGTKVLVTVHPEQARKSWVPFRVLLNYDFQRAKDESRTPVLDRPERNVSVVSSHTDAERAVKRLASASRIAADIEIFDDQRIRCVGFAPSPRDAIVFPDRYFDAAARILTNGVPKIFQNGHGFDAYYLLSRYGVRVNNYSDDVMIAWHACYPELAGTQTDNEGNRKGVKRTHKSLAFFGSLFTLDAWWKDYDFQTEHECYVLNGRDCCITFDAQLAIEKIIEQQGVRAIYEHMMRQVWPVVTITARGLRVDESLRRERLVALEERIGLTAARLNEIVVPLIERERSKNPELLRLFEQIEGVCACCRHASKKQAQCWSCAGFEKAPSKKELVEMGGDPALKKEELEATLLSTCKVCEGKPRREWLEFNCNSSAQKCVLLYDILKLPKRFLDGSLSANEDSMKGLLQYVA